MQDPITLYSPDGQTTKRIPAVDVAGWMTAGWTIELPAVLDHPLASSPPAKKSKKAQELTDAGNAVSEN